MIKNMATVATAFALMGALGTGAVIARGPGEGTREIDPSTKSYRDESGKPVLTPGKKGYVCVGTKDGETDICKKFDRTWFETQKTLLGPGQSHCLDYGHPDLSGNPTHKTTWERHVEPGGYECFPKK
jgi:hypothetical protein